jgi:hypothetical protein
VNIKRNAAILIAAGAVGALGIGGVVGAQADSGSNTPQHSKVSKETSDGDGEVPDAKEGSDGETNDDATDTGPDANPNEPGHQDASDGDGEIPDSQE